MKGEWEWLGKGEGRWEENEEGGRGDITTSYRRRRRRREGRGVEGRVTSHRCALRVAGPSAESLISLLHTWALLNFRRKYYQTYLMEERISVDFWRIKIFYLSATNLVFQEPCA